MTENELKHQILRIARLNGWMVFHMSQSKPSRPVRIQGDATSAGYPDLTLARDGQVIWMELKQDKAMQSPSQYAWQVALPNYHLIRPGDLDAVMVLLA